MEPVSHYYYSDRLKLQFWDWGRDGKPPLMLVHGGLDHARNWDWVARSLREHFHVYAMDLRGHGNSAWAPGAMYSVAEHVLDLSALVDVVGGWFRSTIVGHSLGGIITLMYAGIYPDRVRKVVAIEGAGTPGLSRPLQPAPERMRQWIESVRADRAPNAAQLSGSGCGGGAHEGGQSAFVATKWPRHLTLHGTNWNADGSIDLEIRQLRARCFRLTEPTSTRRPKCCRRITCPTLLFWGRESFAKDPEDEPPAQEIRNRRVVKVDRAGHWVHHDQLEIFLRETKKFLAE